MIDYTVFAERLRNLARRADSAGQSRQDILSEVISIAEDYEAKIEQMEMDMIIEAQTNA